MTQRMDYSAATPAGMKALGGVYGHVMQSGLPKTLVDLVYLRVSQINGCAYCIDMHSRDLLRTLSPSSCGHAFWLASRGGRRRHRSGIRIRGAIRSCERKSRLTSASPAAFGAVPRRCW